MKIVVAITGASGAIYAKRVLEKLSVVKEQVEELAVVFSDSGKEVFLHELGEAELKKIQQLPLKIYANGSFFAPFASGSSGYDALMVAPCSMGTLARIAHGAADNLICRAADVMLKERRKLILLAREAPYSLIHLRNMSTIAEAGGVICPASPSFYSKPQSIVELVDTVVDRALSLAGVEVGGYRWDG
ncbi:MAG: UbiX family flavin prenyltransferase [Prevotellaceae bacterium]|jgi:4-hydroxy-3-polyprenylbenzoate decarboxylase|nr:UbiX family flavin prenyltransferase [Prevotellaceae bacterium]